MDVLYPMVEKKLGAKGKESSAHAKEDHAQIERDLMQALEKRKVGRGCVPQQLTLKVHVPPDWPLLEAGQ